MHRCGWKIVWAVALVIGVQRVWAAPMVFAANQPAMSQTTMTLVTTGPTRMNTRAVDSKISSNLQQLICETDFLLRLQPLIKKANAMAVMVMTKETQQRMHAEMAELWRGVLASLPEKYRSLLQATEFVSVIHDGQMDTQALAQDIINSISNRCPGRLEVLSAKADRRSAQLKRYLDVMFDRLRQQSKIESMI